MRRVLAGLFAWVLSAGAAFAVCQPTTAPANSAGCWPVPSSVSGSDSAMVYLPAQFRAPGASQLITVDNLFSGRTLSGGTVVTGSLTTQNVTIGGTLGVTGATTLSSTLGVTGTATITGVLTANAASNGLVVANQATFGGKIVVNNSTARTLTIDDSGSTSARVYVGSPSTNDINIRSRVRFTGGGTPQNNTENFFQANDTNAITLSGSQFYRHIATSANIGGVTSAGIQVTTFGAGSTLDLTGVAGGLVNVYRSLAVGNGAKAIHVGSQDYVVLNAAGSTNVYITGTSSILDIQTNSGGTGTTGGAALGTYFGRNTAVWLKNSFTGLTGGAKYSQAAVGDEINLKVEGTEQTATIGGTPTNGDTIEITFTSGSIVGSPVTVTATVGTNNALAVIANKVAAAINANTALLNAGVGARVRSGSVVHISWPFPTSITVAKNVTGAATETVTLGTVYDGASTAFRRILQLVPETQDTARGWAGDDAIVIIGGQNTPPSGLYPHGIEFGGLLGQWPITYDGVIIGAVTQTANSGAGTNAQLGAQAAKYGINFPAVDFVTAGGKSLNMPGFGVSGSGALTLGSTILSQTSTDFRIDAAGYVVTSIAISAAGGGGSGGTTNNYFVGDLVRDAYGGLYRVATIDATTGGIATFTIINPSRISSGATPANPVALSGGSGSGATATLTWSSQVTTVALNPTTGGPVEMTGTTRVKLLSAANYLEFVGNTTTNPPTITATGSDTNVGLRVSTKGTGSIDFTANLNSNTMWRFAPTASSDRYAIAAPGTASVPPSIAPIGGTATSLVLGGTSQGTGVVAVGATTGDILIPVGTGAPTGAPALNTLGTAVRGDTGNKKLWYYDGGWLQAGNGQPYFRARLSANQSVTTAVATKVQFDTETFDSNGAYDNATNYRFTPQVAGKYRVVVGIGATASTGTAGGFPACYIYKNGTEYSRNQTTLFNGNAYAITLLCDDIVDMNGSTDYVEGWGRADGTAGVNIVGGGAGSMNSYFSATYVGP